MNTFFTADTHFGHANIIKYCNRPFKNINEMDETLIENWNSKISKHDNVYHLGDFAFREPETVLKYIDRLNGNIFLIKGNHDRINHQIKDKFVWVRDMSEIKVNGINITLCHFAMKVWNKSHHGAWHLYGHSHGTLPDDINSLSIDVGVDANNFMPLNFEDIKIRMGNKNFKPIDHHGSKD